MLRAVIGFALVLHGLIHLIGFVVPWRLAEIRGIGEATVAFWGRVDLSDAGARALGLAWLVGAVLFIVAGVGVAGGAQWALAATGLAAVVSTILCVAGSPAALAGLVIDAAILATLVALQVLAVPGGGT